MRIRGMMTFFVWLFLLDGLMTLALELMHLADSTGGWFAGTQAIMAGMAFLVALGFYGFSAFFARLPKRIIVPLTLFLVWTNFCGAFPLELWARHYTGLVLALLQCAIGAAVFLVYRGEEQFFPLRNPVGNRPEFSWKNLVLYMIGSVALVPVLFVLFALNATVNVLQSSTDGFITVRPSGLFIQERDFEKDGRRVHLIGMMHMANRHFYDSIVEGLPAKSKSVVLLEGVSDRKHVLKGDLGMRRISRWLGLNAQAESTFTEKAATSMEAEENGEQDNDQIRYRRSDLDISDFRPETISCLRTLSEMAAAHSWKELALLMQDPRSPFHNDQNAHIMMDDILEGRNKFILAKIEESLPLYDQIIVPWGAMHMPYLERKLREKGFHEVARDERKALAF